MMVNKIWADEYQKWDVSFDIQFPQDASSLLDFWDKSFVKFQQRDAFIFKNQRFTFDQVEYYSRQLATFLQSLGLPQGSRIAVMLPNIIQYPLLALAIVRAGLILVNVNPLYTARELKHQLNDAGATVLILLDQLLPIYNAIHAEVEVKYVISTTPDDLLIEKQAQQSCNTQNNLFKFLDILEKTSADDYIRPHLNLDDTVLLQYTGGTTGVSKGAELVHKNIMSNLLQNNAVFCSYFGNRDALAGDTMICALPLYHIYAFTVCLLHYTLNKGYTTVLVANPRDIDDLVDCFDKYKPQTFTGVNTLFNALNHHPKFKELDHSRLEITAGGGMTILHSTADQWEKITGCAIREGYGMSETSPVVTFNPPKARKFTGTVGLPSPATEIIILDDQGHALPQGQAGEVAIRGPQVMKGYWNLPEETAQVMTADGFFKTGDIGSIDAQGYLTLLDRKKDMILVSGFNVYPNEIESVLSQHPKVMEVAVVGVADEKSGEVPKAFIVKRDHSLTVDEIKLYTQENLTAYKRPRHIEFISELPKSNVGKILRKELRNK